VRTTGSTTNTLCDPNAALLLGQVIRVVWTFVSVRFVYRLCGIILRTDGNKWTDGRTGTVNMNGAYVRIWRYVIRKSDPNISRQRMCLSSTFEMPKKTLHKWMLEDEDTALPRNVGIRFPNDATWCLRRKKSAVKLCLNLKSGRRSTVVKFVIHEISGEVFVLAEFCMGNFKVYFLPKFNKLCQSWQVRAFNRVLLEIRQFFG
jgi:hypothetical protein